MCLGCREERLSVIGLVLVIALFFVFFLVVRVIS